MNYLQTIIDKFTGKQRLVFVYGVKYKNSGSTVMRTFQLSDIVKDSHLTQSYRICLGPHDRTYKNSILVLSKGALQSLNEKSLKTLQSNGNTLLFDLVDSDLPSTKAVYANQIVAASKGSYDQLINQFLEARVSLVDHHVDPRVYNTKKHQFTDLRVAYFGELVNTVMTPKLEKVITYILVDTSKKSDAWIDELSKYNLHMCIRNQDTDDTNKPFLKGFTAAHTHSSVIVHEKQNDAIRWLGDDYPYILRGKVTEDKIYDIVQQAKQDYGTATWQLSQDRMEKLRKDTQFDFIVSQLEDAIKIAADTRPEA